MSLELIKDKILLNQNLAKEKTQVLLEGDVIVPDNKPDVLEVLKADSKVYINNFEIVDEKVIFEGKLTVNIIYLSKEIEKPVRSLTTSFDIKDSIHIDGLKEDAQIEYKHFLSHIEHLVINDRKIAIKSIIEIEATASIAYEEEVLIDIIDEDNVQFMKTPIKLSKTTLNTDERFVVKDEFSISHSSPNIREIISVVSNITDKEIRVDDGKINIKGSINMNVLYLSGSDEGVAELCEHEIIFNGTIEAENARENMLVDCVLEIENESIQIRIDDDGEDRVFEAEYIILAKSKLTEELELAIIEDVYCIDKNIEIHKETISYPKLVCSNKNQFTHKETVEIGQESPRILQIYQVSASVVIEESSILDDKIFVEGYIPTDILYLASDDAKPLYAYNGNIVFQQQIDARGVKENMAISLDASIEHISYSMLSETEIELRYIISFNLLVQDFVTATVIKDLDITERSIADLEKISSITIYVVQADDNLWRIAKRYNTSVEEIMKLNDIDEEIMPGQKLLILKKLVE